MHIAKTLSLLLLLSGQGLLGMSQTLIQEDFNAGLPATWTVVDGGTTTDTWFGTTNGYNNNFLDGSEFAFVDSDAAGNGPAFVLDEQLITPVINGNLYSQLFLEFDHHYRQISTDTGFVQVYNGTTWVTLAAYTNDTGNFGNPDHPVFNLTPYLNANLRVRFYYRDNAVWAWYWGIDNVRIFAPFALDAELTTLNVPTSNCGLSTTETISVDIHNLGLSTMSNYSVSYQVNGAGIITETVSTPIASGNTLSYTFVTGANLSAAGPHDIRAWVKLAGDGDNANDTLTAPTLVNHPRVSTFPYVEDFESGPGAWFTTGTNVSWAWGTPAKDVIQGAASGVNAWVTGGLGTTNYNNNEQNQVESPCFDFTNLSNPWVGMDIWWNAEFSWDGAALQVSTNGGLSWQTVGMFGDPYNWYTDNTIDAQPGGQNEGWTGRAATQDGSNGYVRAVHSLASLAGEPEVVLRMVFASDGTVTDDGVAFDNFTVGQGPTLYLGPDTLACDSVVLDAGPGQAYLWSTGDTTRFLTVDTSGIYLAEVRDNFGFPVTDQIQVTILNSGGLDLGRDTLLCGTAGITLQANPNGQTFNWSTGATTPTLQVNNSGTYWVEVTYGPGCIDTDTIAITVSPLQADISLSMDTLCTGTVIPFMDGSVGALSWLWDFGDGSFSVNANPLHAYASGGTFLVSLTVTDSFCTDVAVRPVFVDICTGIEDAQAGIEVHLAPNPASETTRVQVRSDQVAPVVLELFDLRGRPLWHTRWMQAAGTSEKWMNLSGYPRGIYLLRIQIGEAIFYEKLWKSVE